MDSPINTGATAAIGILMVTLYLLGIYMMLTNNPSPVWQHQLSPPPS